MRTDIMGVGFDPVTMEGALALADEILAKKVPGYCVTPNPEIVYEAMEDGCFRNLVNEASMVLPDGIGVILAGKILGTPLPAKVSGADFAAHLLADLEYKGRSLYLLGSKPGVGQLAAEKMLEKHPNLKIVGIQDGYYQDEAAVVAEIAEARPDVLFVCLGSPKQEIFMAKYKIALGVPLMIGLGGTLDAFAGTVKRAPVWIQKIGFEWLYRMCKEPKRFKRFWRLPKFLFAVMGKRLKGR